MNASTEGKGVVNTTIVVVGPGAIGCLFAAALAEAGHDVRLLDKDPTRAESIARCGVKVDEPQGSRTVRVPVTADARTQGPVDVVCLCVKSYDTASAAACLSDLMGPETAIVSLQNGFGNAERISGQVGPRGVICAVTAHGATCLGAGHVVHAGEGVTTLAARDPAGRGAAERVAAVLSASGLEARVVDDALSLVWSKLAINAAINPVTAVWGVPNGEILDRPELVKVSMAAAEEAQTVATAGGVTLLYADATAAVREACERTKENISSMLQDVRRGKRTEIDDINGAIVKEARTQGIKVPVNEMLVQRVHALTSSA